LAVVSIKQTQKSLWCRGAFNQAAETALLATAIDLTSRSSAPRSRHSKHTGCTLSWCHRYYLILIAGALARDGQFEHRRCCSIYSRLGFFTGHQLDGSKKPNCFAHNLSSAPGEKVSTQVSCFYWRLCSSNLHRQSNYRPCGHVL
jgi:hypothetical protein